MREIRLGNNGRVPATFSFKSPALDKPICRSSPSYTARLTTTQANRGFGHSRAPARSSLASRSSSRCRYWSTLFVLLICPSGMPSSTVSVGYANETTDGPADVLVLRVTDGRDTVGLIVES